MKDLSQFDAIVYAFQERTGDSSPLTNSALLMALEECSEMVALKIKGMLKPKEQLIQVTTQDFPPPLMLEKSNADGYNQALSDVLAAISKEWKLEDK